MRSAVRGLAELGARAALITGGALGGPDALDVLFDGEQIHEFRGRRFEQQAHGAGCTLSAAIAALLARDYELIDAVRSAKDFVSRAIQHSPPFGHGSRLLNHFANQTVNGESTENDTRTLHCSERHDRPATQR